MSFFFVLLAAIIPADVDRLVVVRAAGWDATAGEVVRFTRAKAGWAPAGAPVRAELGKGLAWGRGVVAVDRPGPKKEEGDGRTPAGLFRVGDAFGYADRPDGVALAWRRMGNGDVCVDDPGSRHYNRFARDEDKDWASAEVMRRADDLYELGAVILHNADAVPRAGSCIFFHVARRRGSPTVGCVALPRADLLSLLRFMAPDRTVVAILPDEAYLALRGAWGLPDLPGSSIK
ncbi:MAG TPA: L,D-transpeptidase family protein [Haliangiales bacterium]|nr:L,D-transpeptidase family protein [Haliangiales bacterium]